MSLSKNLNNYRHIIPVLDEAMKRGGGVYKLLNKTAALRWRMEAYQMRKLLAINGATKYDDLVLSIEGANIKMTIRKVEGLFYTPEGKEVKLQKELTPAMDDLEAFAMGLGLSVEDDEENDGNSNVGEHNG